jgi:hypothetical protein
MVEGSRCSCSCPMWKVASCAMTTKMSQIHHGSLCAHCHGCNIKGGYP